jgi:hypothetical protein
LASKVHALTNDLPMRLAVTPGEAHDIGLLTNSCLA